MENAMVKKQVFGSAAMVGIIRDVQECNCHPQIIPENNGRIMGKLIAVFTTNNDCDYLLQSVLEHAYVNAEDSFQPGTLDMMQELIDRLVQQKADNEPKPGVPQEGSNYMDPSNPEPVTGTGSEPDSDSNSESDVTKKPGVIPMPGNLGG